MVITAEIFRDVMATVDATAAAVVLREILTVAVTTQAAHIAARHHSALSSATHVLCAAAPTTNKHHARDGLAGISNTRGNTFLLATRCVSARQQLTPIPTPADQVHSPPTASLTPRRRQRHKWGNGPGVVIFPRRRPPISLNLPSCRPSFNVGAPHCSCCGRGIARSSATIVP